MTSKRQIQKKSTVAKNILNKTYAEKFFFIVIGIPIVFWAFAFPLIKIALKELSPINLTIMRLFIVCLAFLVVLFFQHKKLSKFQKKTYHLFFFLDFWVLLYTI